MVPIQASRGVMVANVPAAQAGDATIQSFSQPDSAQDRLELGQLDPGDLHFKDVENNQGRLRLLSALAKSQDPVVRSELQDAVNRWTKEALDACFKGKAAKDEKAALTDYHARMAAFASQTGLTVQVQAGVQKAVTDRENKLNDQLKAHHGLFGRIFDAVTGVVGSIIDVISHVTDKTLDSFGWLVQHILHLVGLVLALPFKGVALALDAVGLHLLATAVRDVGKGVLRVVDVVAEQVHGFCAGLGDAFKGTFDGMKFLIQHPIVAVKGMVNMVIHPGTILVALQAMWAEARRGGPGHTAGYLVGNLAPMFLTGGASDGTFINTIAHSSMLEGTMVSRVLIGTATRVSNSLEILRRLSTFDIGGVVDGISNFDKPLVVVRAGASAFQTTRLLAGGARSLVTHPVVTARALGAHFVEDAKRLVTGGKAVGSKAGKAVSETRTAARVVRDVKGPVGGRLLAADQVFKKGVKTADAARALGQAQATADKITARLATENLRAAFRALWARDFDGFMNHIGSGADAISNIQTLNDAINGVSHVANAVGDVLDPGGSLEGALNNRLVKASGATLSTNQVMALAELLRLNQEGVYEGDQARLRKDRDNGILKVLNI